MIKKFNNTTSFHGDVLQRDTKKEIDNVSISEKTFRKLLKRIDALEDQVQVQQEEIKKYASFDWVFQQLRAQNGRLDSHDMISKIHMMLSVIALIVAVIAALQ